MTGERTYSQQNIPSTLTKSSLATSDALIVILRKWKNAFLYKSQFMVVNLSLSFLNNSQTAVFSTSILCSDGMNWNWSSENKLWPPVYTFHNLVLIKAESINKCWGYAFDISGNRTLGLKKKREIANFARGNSWPTIPSCHSLLIILSCSTSDTISV